MATIQLTEQNFEATVTGEGITLIDFWAEWCGPCKMFGPIFEAASEEHPDVRFAKVDTEAEQGIAAFFQIQSIPTVFVFRDGVPLGGKPGAMSATGLNEFLQKVREIDMEQVHRDIAEAEKAEAEKSNDAQ
jgi:thioredoxin 1